MDQDIQGTSGIVNEPENETINSSTASDGNITAQEFITKSPGHNQSGPNHVDNYFSINSNSSADNSLDQDIQGMSGIVNEPENEIINSSTASDGNITAQAFITKSPGHNQSCPNHVNNLVITNNMENRNDFLEQLDSLRSTITVGFEDLANNFRIKYQKSLVSVGTQTNSYAQETSEIYHRTETNAEPVLDISPSPQGDDQVSEPATSPGMITHAHNIIDLFDFCLYL